MTSRRSYKAAAYIQLGVANDPKTAWWDISVSMQPILHLQTAFSVNQILCMNTWSHGDVVFFSAEILQ